MKKTIKKIVAVMFAAAITVLSPLSVSAAGYTDAGQASKPVKYTDGQAFEDEYAKLTDNELKIIAQREAEGYTLFDIWCHTDKATGLYFIDMTFVKYGV